MPDHVDRRTAVSHCRDAGDSSLVVDTIERLFRAETGLSFGKWRVHARLLHGMRRLAAGDKVTVAALEAGCAGVGAFTA